MSEPDAARHNANRAAHRGMRVLCDMVNSYDWPGNTIISKPDADVLRAAAREYEEAWQQAQGEALR